MIFAVQLIGAPAGVTLAVALIFGICGVVSILSVSGSVISIVGVVSTEQVRVNVMETSLPVLGLTKLPSSELPSLLNVSLKLAFFSPVPCVLPVPQLQTVICPCSWLPLSVASLKSSLVFWIG